MSIESETSASVHGHEVIHLILDSNPPLSRAQLGQEVTRRWGAEARFHTCHDEGLTLDGLVSFLLSRGKIVEENGKLVAQMHRVCNDGQH